MNVLRVSLATAAIFVLFLFFFITQRHSGSKSVEVEGINELAMPPIPAEITNRATLALLGQFVGDALGTRYEFSSPGEAEKQVDEDIAKNGGKLKILGGGPFRLDPGQATDDTELAMALGRSIIRCGRYNIEDVAQSYRKWYESDPFDIGTTTTLALGVSVLKGESVSKTILERTKESTFQSLSNGCLMRSSTLGIAGWNWDRSVLAETARLDSQLTNPNPVAQDAVAAYVVAVATAIRGDGRKAFEAGHETAVTDTVKSIIDGACDHFYAEWSPGGMGYLGVALQMAFHELLSSRSFYHSMEQVVRHGGDTDTNGCITGALIGAVKGGIPEDWVQNVRSCRPWRLWKYPWVSAEDLDKVVQGLLRAKEK